MYKILLVEDDYMTLEGIVRIIPWTEIGIEHVETAEDGLIALDVAQRFEPDIVLSDIYMPRMNGIEFAFKLREILPECKIIFMSAYTDKEYYKSAIKLNAISYVEKPIDVEELKDSISNSVAILNRETADKNRSNEMTQTLRSNIPLIRNELVMQLLRKDADADIIKQKCKVLSLDISPDFIFCTVIIKLPDTRGALSSVNDSMNNHLLGTINEIFSQDGLNSLSALKDSEHIVAHLYANNEERHHLSQSNLNSLCIRIYESLKEDFSVSIAAGKVVPGMKNIHESYVTGVQALQKNFYRSAYPVTVYSPDNSQPYNFDGKLTERFSDFLSKADRYNLCLAVKSLTSEVRLFPNTPVNSVKNEYYRLVLQLLLSAEASGIRLINPEESKEYIWEKLSGIDSLNQLEDYVTDKIETYFRLLEERSKYSATVTDIINYIHANYSSQVLSTKDISEHTSLTSSYICVLFKEETGKTINRYITEYRIEKSKEYLRDRTQKIANIAEKVGYQEGDYFAKIFRKVTGLSPSEYRERR